MAEKAFSFKKESSTRAAGARAGVLTTPHGTIKTPTFAPVGTKGAVRGVLPEQLREVGTQVVLANTYHLYLSPGEKLVQEAGGLAKFVGWAGPTITDSGGFQVFSLGVAYGKKISKFSPDDAVGLKDIVSPSSDEGLTMSKHGLAVYDEDVASQHGQLAIIDDEGVSFTSHLDGSLHRFTPERSVEIQHALGADIFFAFDECTAPTEPFEYQREAMERTHRWAERSLRAHQQNIEANAKQMIFGIAQGGQFDDLRRESAKAIGSMGFDGFGLGGSFSKKYGDDSLESALKMLAEIPPELPVHGLGVGEPGDILLAISHGVDLFDCVAPTRLARHGTIYTSRGPIHLKSEKYRTDLTPLSDECWDIVSPTSDVGLTMSHMPGQQFTKAYVAHLLHSGEMLGATICSLHNLHFILSLVAGAREAILENRFDQYREEFVKDYYQT